MPNSNADDPSVETLNIGDKVRRLREKNHYSLQDLTAKTGLAVDQLSQIEKDEIVPPVAILLKLARALNVDMVYFFQDKASDSKIAITRREERVRIERRPHHQKGEVSYIYETLEAKKINKQMEPFMVVFPPQKTDEMVFVSHKGEEFLHLLEGMLEFRSIDQVHCLYAGDSIYFESDMEHSFRCIGDLPARALVVVWNA